MDINDLLNQVKTMIFNDPSTPQQPGNDPTGLISQIEGLFRQHQEQQPERSGGFGNVRPASEDPLGDPADAPGGNADPRFGNLKPASEDPLGDPADQE